MGDISVIVVNWNSEGYVDACVTSLERHCASALAEIIVVDNGSCDGCEAMLARKHPRVRFIQLTENVGFGRANNVGAEAATGAYLWLLNPDTEVHSDVAAALREPLVAFPWVGVVGARLLNTDGTLQTSCVQPLPTPWNQSFDSEWLRTAFGIWGMSVLRAGKPTAVPAVSGACMMTRKADFDRIGGFAPEYFMYVEDLDLCRRMQTVGLKAYYQPDAAVTHHGGGSSRQQCSRFSVVMSRNSMALYFRQHHSAVYCLIGRALLAASAACRVLFLSIVDQFRSPGPHSASITKWRTVLSWCCGRERTPSKTT